MSKKQLPFDKNAGWRELPIGGVIPVGGTAECFETGDWRMMRPIHHRDKCIDCLICWAYCPDMSIRVEDGKVMGYDYDHCKGCGICANVCPVKDKAITMISESEGRKLDAKKEEAV